MDIQTAQAWGSFFQAVGFPIGLLVVILIVYMDFRPLIKQAIIAHVSLAKTITDVAKNGTAITINPSSSNKSDGNSTKVL